MPEFYIVPPRLIVGSFDRANVVTSVNNLRGDLTFTGDLNGGITVKISGNNIQYSTIPGFFVKRAGDTFLGNLDFTPSGSNYGLALAQLPSDPGTGRTGGLYFNTTSGEIKYYYGSVGWTSISFQSGITIGFADARYLKLDGTNDPMQGDLSMNTYFFQVGNKATQVSAGSAGQIYWNTDSYRLEVYNDNIMAWEPIGGLAITQLNGLTQSLQSFSTGTSGSLFNIASNSGIHTFNIPIAGTGATGLVSTLAQSFAGSKTFTSDTIISSTTQSTTKGSGALSVYGGLAVSSNVSIGHTLLFFNPNNSNYIGIRANSPSSNATYILPSSTPASGSSFLSSATDGTLSWNAVLSVPLSSIATTAQNINLVSAIADTTYYLTFSNRSSGSGVALSAGTALTYNAATKALSSDLFLGNLAGNAVTATNFYGTLNGTATTSTNVHVTSTGNTSSNHFLLLSRFETGTGLAVSSATGLSYNPSTGVLIGTTFQGNVQGNVLGNLTGFATTATNINVVSSGSNSTNHFLLFTRFETGTGLAVSSATGLSYNPSTGVLIGTTFQGNLSGIANTAIYSYQAGYAITSGLATSSTYSDKVAIVETDANFAHPLVFSLNTATSSTGTALSIDDTATYNPSSNILNLSSGSLAANGVTIGLAQRTISTNSGNLILDSVGGTVQVNDNLTVSGNLNVQGTTTTIDSTVTSFVDPVIVLGSAAGNTHSLIDDNKDRGVEFRYAESGSAITGFFGYKDDKKFYYIPNASVNDNVYTGTAGTIVANLEGIASTSNYALIAGNAISTDSVKRGNQYELGWYSATGIAITGSGAGLTWNSSTSTLTLSANSSPVLNIEANAPIPLNLDNGLFLTNNSYNANAEYSPALTFKIPFNDVNEPGNYRTQYWQLSSESYDYGTAYIDPFNLLRGEYVFSLDVSDNNTTYGNIYERIITATASTGFANGLYINSNIVTNSNFVSHTGRLGIGATLYFGTENSATRVGIQRSASSTGITVYTLPPSTPGSGNSVLQSSISGVMSWVPLVAAIATSTSSVFINTGNSNSNHPVIFTPTSSSSGSALSTDATLLYNPSTDTLQTGRLLASSGQSARFYNLTSLSSGYDAALYVEGGLAVSNNIAVRRNVLIGSTYPANINSTQGAVGATFIRIVSPEFGYNGMGVQFWDGQATLATDPTFALVTTAGGSRAPGLTWSGSGSSTDLAIYRDSTNALNIAVLDATRGNIYDRLVIGDNGGAGSQFTFGFSSAGNSRNIRFATVSPVSGSDLNGGEWRFIGLQGRGNGTPGTFLFFTGDRDAANPTTAHSTTTALTIDEFGVIVGFAKGTNSTSTLTGTARINGGLGVTGNAFIGGTVTITNTTTSTLTTNGALVVSGGVGIGGSVFVGGELNIRFGKELRIFNSNNARYNAFKTGANGVDITYTLPTALPATGTGNSVLVSNDSGTLSWTVMSAGGGGAGTVDQGLIYQIPYYPSGGALVTGSSNFTNIPGSGVTITNFGSNSSSTTTGALVVRGGVGITGNLYVGGIIVGNLTGTATTASNVQVQSTNDAGTRYLTFVNTASSSAGLSVSTDTNLTYDAATNILNVGILSGSAVSFVNGANYTAFKYSGSAKTTYTLPDNTPQGTGTSVLASDQGGIMYWTPMSATSSGSATTAKNIETTLTDANSSHYLIFSNNSGTSGVALSSTSGLQINPSSDAFITGSWQASAIATTYGGTGLTTYNQGDILVGTGSSVLSILPKGTNRYVLSSNTYYPNGIGWTQVAGVSITNLAPSISTALNTDLWWNNEDGSFNIYYNDGNTSQWVEISNAFINPDTVQISSTNSIGTKYLTFSDTSSGSGVSLFSDTNLTYDSSSNQLFVGSLSGTGISILNGSNYSAFVYAGSAKTTYTLPTNTPQSSAGTSVLSSTIDGVMSWVPMTATGGANIGYTVFGGNNFELAYYFQNGTGVTGTQYIHNVGTGMSILYGTNSTSTSSGALTVRGGLGLTGNAFIGGTVVITNTTNSISINSGALEVDGGIGIGQSVSLGGRLQLFNSSLYTAIVSSQSGISTVYTLPATTPQSAAGTSVLSSTIGGVMSWVPLTGGPGGSGTVTQINAGIGLTTNPNGPITTSGTIIARRIHRIQFASSFNPTLGADTAVFTIPFDPNDGTSSMTMRMKRVECRVETASALGSSFSIQKYAYRGGLGVTQFNTDSAVFIGSTTNIMPAFLEIKGADTYEVNQTTFAGSHITAVSGDKMRLFFNDISAIHQNFSISLLMEQEI